MTAIEQIKNYENFLQKTLSSLSESNKGYICQTVLLGIRDLLDAINVIIYTNEINKELNWNNIDIAKKHLPSLPKAEIFKKCFKQIQGVSSHYILDEINSEHFINTFISHLIELRKFVKNRIGIDVLANIEILASEGSNDLEIFYREIRKSLELQGAESFSATYYIMSQKPIFIDRKLIYEISLSDSKKKSNKLGNVIVFSNKRLPFEYRATLAIENSEICINRQKMPIKKIIDYHYAIKAKGINKLGSIVNIQSNLSSNNNEYKNLMNFIKRDEINLLDVVESTDQLFERTISALKINCTTNYIEQILREYRNRILTNTKGSNILRYLLNTLCLEIIEEQYESKPNIHLSNLYLTYRAIPFDGMPYCTSLAGHNPGIGDLLDCISPEKRQHEFLARRLNLLTGANDSIYIEISNFEKFGDEKAISSLIKRYNNSLYSGHYKRKICIIDNKYLCTRENEENTIKIVTKLQEMASKPAERYDDYYDNWIEERGLSLDSQEKEKVLKSLFSHSSVAIINGAAGTGKTKLIKYASAIYAGKKRVFLAFTHAAIENLRSKVGIPDGSICETITTYKWKLRHSGVEEMDLLVIDECSVISSQDMADILELVKPSALLLVGDAAQLPAIKFGNWFHIINHFLPKYTISELKENFRSNSPNLKDLWTEARNMGEQVHALIAHGNYSSELSENIFTKNDEDEIILTLNYNGLFGINNINTYFQNANPNREHRFSINSYKVNDPVIFLETERFENLFHNNLKGRILEISKQEDGLFFKLEVKRIITERECTPYNVTLYPDEKTSKKTSVVGFKVLYESPDLEQEDINTSCIVPFQVAYAVSIHKSQGLEYNSVKIIITDNIEDHITHNVFYTAITRTREKLKIYWNAEVEKRIISSFSPRNFNSDISNLMRRISGKANISIP